MENKRNFLDASADITSTRSSSASAPENRSDEGPEE